MHATRVSGPPRPAPAQPCAPPPLPYHPSYNDEAPARIVADVLPQGIYELGGETESLNIALATIGSTGDLMPFRWLARALFQRGASVRVLSHPDHAAYFATDPVKFVATGPELEWERLDSVRERLATTRNPVQLSRLVLREVTLHSPGRHYADCLEALVDCDALVSHHLYFAAQEAAETHGIPWASAVLMPNMIQSDQHPPTHEVPFSGSRLANRLWWRISNALVAAASREIQHTMESLSGRKRAVSFFGGFSTTLNLLAASPAISSLPRNLYKPFTITGAWLPPEGSPDELPSEIQRFLASGTPPILVSLGSAGYEAAGETTRIVREAINPIGCRALIYAGPESKLSDTCADPAVAFIGFVPYQNLLSEVSAVVHHGGAGTTALTCRAGLPSVLVPHFADHFYWSKALVGRGAAPRPVSRRSLTTKRLAGAIRGALTESRYREAAKQISERMRDEEGARTGADHVLEWARRSTSR